MRTATAGGEGALTPQQRVKILALEQLHHEVGLPPGGIDAAVEQLRDVWRLEGAGRVGFALKTLREDVVRPLAEGAHQLDGHPKAAADVTGLEHLPHAAAAEGAFEEVLAVEQLADHGAGCA
jgi:hypothetical protein